MLDVPRHTLPFSTRDRAIRALKAVEKYLHDQSVVTDQALHLSSSHGGHCESNRRRRVGLRAWCVHSGDARRIVRPRVRVRCQAAIRHALLPRYARPATRSAGGEVDGHRPKDPARSSADDAALTRTLSALPAPNPANERSRATAVGAERATELFLGMAAPRRRSIRLVDDALELPRERAVAAINLRSGIPEHRHHAARQRRFRH
jgi:hypothetical protein